MAVEEKAITSAISPVNPNDVWALWQKPDDSGFKAFLPKPCLNKVSYLLFLTRWAINFA